MHGVSVHMEQQALFQAHHWHWVSVSPEEMQVCWESLALWGQLALLQGMAQDGREEKWEQKQEQVLQEH